MIKINRDFFKLANWHKDRILIDYNLVSKIDDIIGKSSDANEISFYTFLKNNLEKILSSDLDHLTNTIVKGVDTILGKDFFTETEPSPGIDKNGNPKEIKVIKNKAQIEKVFSVFNYKKFSESRSRRYCAYDLVDALGVNVCLYCNRQYISNVKSQTKTKKREAKSGTRATLAHH